MKIIINDIKSDRENILRFVTNSFKNTIIISKLKSNQSLYSDYQKITNQYKSQLRKLLYIINSNSDMKLYQIKEELDKVLTYLEDISINYKICKSDIVINDNNKVLIQFLESKFSDLLKIDVI